MFKDNNDPVLFEGAGFESANMTVLHCREVMERTGMTEEARRLHGVEVTGPAMATVALEILHNMRARAEAEYARKLAIQSVKDALTS